MTDFKAIPIPPPMLGDVLASPSAYAEAAVAGQTPCSFSPVTRARHARRARRGTGRRPAVRVAVLAAAGLSALGWAGGARAAVRPAGVTVASPAVRHAESVTARFGVCVEDIQAYALRGPAEDDYSVASTVHRGRVRAGHAVRLVFRFRAGDAGRWGSVEVTGWECGRSRVLRDGSPDWSHMVTVTGAASFVVVAR